MIRGGIRRQKIRLRIEHTVLARRKKVTVYKLIAKNTIEEKIKELQEKKKNLAEQVISGDMGQLGAMTRQELLELLGV